VCVLMHYHLGTTAAEILGKCSRSTIKVWCNNMPAETGYCTWPT